MICIYKILNIITNKIYVGSTNNLYKRKYNHLSKLKKNTHPNKHLQSSFNIYKEENFYFEILEECSLEKLIEREQYYLDTLLPEYNIRKIAESNRGVKLSEKHKNLLRSYRVGVPMNKVTKEAIIKANTGRKLSQETKKKISNNSKGKNKSEQTKINMSLGMKGRVSPRKGVKLSQELKQKMSESRKRYLQNKLV